MIWYIHSRVYKRGVKTYLCRSPHGASKSWPSLTSEEEEEEEEEVWWRPFPWFNRWSQRLL